MIVPRDTIALRKLFSLLNAQGQLIVLKNQSTSKHVKEDTIVTMRIINSRQYVQWIIIAQEVLRSLFFALQDIYVKKEVNFLCFAKLVTLLNRLNTGWLTHVRCVPRVLTQPSKMNSVILALLAIYVMAKQVRSILLSSGSTRVKYALKATIVLWGHIWHSLALLELTIQKLEQVASPNAYYVLLTHSTIGLDKVAAGLVVPMHHQLRDLTHVSA